MNKKTVIVGGVAGGASAAARLRRLDEAMDIVLIERGEYISYANCGLPYHVGGVIKDREKLFVMTPGLFCERFNVDVRVNNEVLSIDRAKREVTVLDRVNGRQYRESYDYLVLSPGAEPVRPPLPGIENPAVFTMRSVADTDRITGFIRDKQPSTAVVIGAGFIGLEMAENLKTRDMKVTVVEAAPAVLPPIDPEMAALVQQELRAAGVSLRLGDSVAGFREAVKKGEGEESGKKNSVVVTLLSGAELTADMVILSIGVKPEVKLALEAGLDVDRGIRVNESLQTSDSRIYALGDAVEVVHLVTGKQVVLPLAGPANKQGRIVAGNIAGRRETYAGTQGTAVLKVFEMSVALTGVNEKTLRESGLDYRTAIIHPDSHAGYYPGSSPLSLKLLFSPGGRIFGAQAVGYGGADKRIDVIATSMRAGLSVYDLQSLELCYAPPFSSARDPVNVAGYVAGNILQDDVKMIDTAELMAGPGAAVTILDVREEEEYALGSIRGSVNIPLGQLRGRIEELPSKDRELVVYCAVGIRSYIAARILAQKGFTRVRSLNGGYRIYRVLEEEGSKQADDTL